MHAPTGSRLNLCLVTSVLAAILLCSCAPKAVPPATPLSTAPTPTDQLSGPPATYRDGFERDFVPHVQTRGRSKLEGELPEGWEIRTLFNEFSGSVSRMTGNVPEGSAGFRVVLDHLHHTYFDMSPTLRVPAGKVIRIQVQARSPSTARLDVGLKAAGSSSDTLSWVQRRVYVPAEWMQLEFLIPPRITGEDAAEEQLVFRLVDPAVVELDHLRVWVMDLEDLNAGIPEREGNLLPQSQFFYGLPLGWSRGSAGWRHRTDLHPDLRSPDGAPALQVPRGGGFLCTPPFQARGGRETRIQGWIRGAREGQKVRLEFTAPPQSRMHRFTIDQDWHWLDVQLDTPYPIEGFQVLKFHTRETFWLSGLTVSQTETQNLAPQSELHLFHPDPYALQDPGTPLTFSAAMFGPESGVLTGTVEDVYGHRIPFGPLPIQPGERLSVEVEAQGLSPLGSYRVEVRLEDSNGTPQTPWSEMMVHRIRRPRKAGVFAPDSPFGVHAGATITQASMVKRLGFNWVRMHDAANGLKWSRVEPRKGRMSFSAGEQQVKLFRDHHLNILGVLDTSPPWASDVQRQKPGGPWNDYWDKHWVPRDQEAWKAYCRNLTDHFHDTVDAWEIWNEPYVGRFFRKNWNEQSQRAEKGTPQDYARLAEAARNAVSDVHASKLLIANKAGDWGKQALQRGIPDGINLLSFHLYTPQHQGFPGDSMSKTVAALQTQVVEAARPEAGIWNTEGGPGPTIHTFFQHTGPDQPGRMALDQANGLVRQYLSQLAYGVEKFFLYSLHGAGAWSPSWVVMAPSDELPPHASALSNLFWQLEDTRLSRSVQVEQGQWLLFSGPDREVTVWLPTPGNTEPFIPPPGTEVTDLFGNVYTPVNGSPSWPVFLAGNHLPAASSTEKNPASLQK